MKRNLPAVAIGKFLITVAMWSIFSSSSICGQFSSDPASHNTNDGNTAAIARLIDLYTVALGQLEGQDNAMFANLNTRHQQEITRFKNTISSTAHDIKLGREILVELTGATIEDGEACECDHVEKALDYASPWETDELGCVAGGCACAAAGGLMCCCSGCFGAAAIANSSQCCGILSAAYAFTSSLMCCSGVTTYVAARIGHHFKDQRHIDKDLKKLSGVTNLSYLEELVNHRKKFR